MFDTCKSTVTLLIPLKSVSLLQLCLQCRHEVCPARDEFSEVNDNDKPPELLQRGPISVHKPVPHSGNLGRVDPQPLGINNMTKKTQLQLHKLAFGQMSIQLTLSEQLHRFSMCL